MEIRVIISWFFSLIPVFIITGLSSAHIFLISHLQAQ